MLSTVREKKEHISPEKPHQICIIKFHSSLSKVSSTYFLKDKMMNIGENSEFFLGFFVQLNISGEKLHLLSTHS